MIASMSLTPSGQAVQTLHVTATRGLVSAHGLSGPTQVRGEVWSRPEEWGIVEPAQQFLAARIVTCEGWIVQPTLDAMWSDWRTLAAAFSNCLSADAILKFQEGTAGPQLQGNVRLAGDVLPPIEGSYGVLRYMVQLRAADPFWYSQTEQTATGTGTSTVFQGGIPFPIPFPIPFFQSNQLSAAAVAVSGGTVGTWPKITVTGPITGPAVLNTTTGEQLYLPSLSVAAGQTLVIECKPQLRSVTVSGSSVVGAIDYTRSSFPRMIPGTNTFQLTGGGTTGSTVFTVAWRDGFL